MRSRTRKRAPCLQPAAAFEPDHHADEDHEHAAEDDEEGGETVLARHLRVHSPDAGDQGQRQDHDADRGQDAEDVVEAVRDHRLVGLLERLDHLLVVLQHVPDPLVRVDDVVEVDLEVEVGGEVARFHFLQVAQDRALRTDHLAEVDDLLLGVGDVADDVLGAALEDVVLERVELVADLAQHREAVVEAVVDEAVEQVARAAREELLAELLFLAAALEQVLDRLQRLVRDRDEEVGADEEVELTGAEPLGGTVEDREVQDAEQVLVVDVDLRPLVAREDVLEVERVEVEVLLEPGALKGTRMLDVDPTKATPLDLLDPRCLGLNDLGRSDEPAATTASQPWFREVRHPPLPSTRHGRDLRSHA